MPQREALGQLVYGQAQQVVRPQRLLLAAVVCARDQVPEALIREVQLAAMRGLHPLVGQTVVELPRGPAHTQAQAAPVSQLRPVAKGHRPRRRHASIGPAAQGGQPPAVCLLWYCVAVVCALCYCSFLVPRPRLCSMLVMCFAVLGSEASCLCCRVDASLMDGASFLGVSATQARVF